MADIYLAVIAVAVVVIAITQVTVAMVAVRAATEARALARRVEEELGPVLVEVRRLSTEAARSAALIASQAERVDQLTSRVTRRFDEIAASPVREGLALVRTVVELFGGGGPTRPPSRPRKPAPDRTDTRQPD